MKKENNISVNMIRMSNNYVPFVKVDFMDKDTSYSMEQAMRLNSIFRIRNVKIKLR